MFKYVIWGVAAFSLTGCASHFGHYQTYQGVELAPTEQAIIQGSNNYRRGALANELIRIVAVDGKDVPRQWGYAEGADSVAVLPGTHIIKILSVHGARTGIDYYSYDSIPLRAVPNCTYQIISSIDIKTEMISFSFIGFPSSKASSPECGYEEINIKSNKPVSI